MVVGKLMLGILLYIVNLTLSEGSEWGYNHGVKPAEWKNIFPTCNGLKQSPINIPTDLAKTSDILDTFNFDELSRSGIYIMEMTNNGHSVQVNLQGEGLELSGGGLPGTYRIAQFHFHWGMDNSRGSEHWIDGRQFPMEMHVVTYSSGFSDGLKEAMKYPDGLAVLGFLFTVGEHNPNFDEIINNLKNVQNKGDQVLLEAFDLTSLFPSTRCYFRYYGSLTTPTCDESVIWTIFNEKIEISENQLNEFRILSSTSGDLMNNFREPQPLNGRSITTNCIYV